MQIILRNMANNGNLITAPVRVTDIKTVLGVSNNNVSYLCSNTHGKTNKWSLWKPVRNAKTNGITESEIANTTSGLQPKVITFRNNVLSNPEEWSYLPPNTSAWPKRMGDFRNYNNQSIPFLYMGDLTWDYISQPIDYLYFMPAFRFNNVTGQWQNGHSVYDVAQVGIYMNGLKSQYNEVPDFSNWYMGVAIKYGGSIYWLYSDGKIGEAKQTQPLKIPVSQLGISNKLYQYIKTMPDTAMLDCVPFLAPVKGAYDSIMYSFPLGETVKLKKHKRPLYPELSYNISEISIYSSNTGILGTMVANGNPSSPSILKKPIKSSGATITISGKVNIRNNSNAAVHLPLGSTTGSQDVKTGIYMNIIPFYFGISWRNANNTSITSVTIPANSSVNLNIYSSTHCDINLVPNFPEWGGTSNPHYGRISAYSYLTYSSQAGDFEFGTPTVSYIAWRT